MAKKSTASEMDQRISEVFHLLLASKPRAEILQYGSKWAISDRAIDTLITKARDRIKEIMLKDADEAMASFVHMKMEVYKKALADNQLEVARKTVDDLVKMSGLDTPDKIEITNVDKQAQQSESKTLLSIVKASSE